MDLRSVVSQRWPWGRSGPTLQSDRALTTPMTVCSLLSLTTCLTLSGSISPAQSQSCSDIYSLSGKPSSDIILVSWFLIYLRNFPPFFPFINYSLFFWFVETLTTIFVSFWTKWNVYFCIVQLIKFYKNEEKLNFSCQLSVE